MPPFGDLLVCGVSTRLDVEQVGFDELILRTDDDFRASGLRTDSLIRLGFLLTVPVGRAPGAIGHISPERHKRLLERLAHFLTP
jgi:mRNA interferase MazF